MFYERGWVVLLLFFGLEMFGFSSFFKEGKFRV